MRPDRDFSCLIVLRDGVAWGVHPFFPSKKPTTRMSDKIRSAVYSNIHVYEMLVRGTPVMIRKGDQFVNATQILRAAGLPKPARTKVLEREGIFSSY
jgi:hypothetical protein